MTALVFVVVIALVGAQRVSQKLPALHLGFGGMAILKADTAAQLMAAVGGCFDARMLPAIAMTANELIKAVVTVSIRVWPAESGAYRGGCGFAADTDTMGTFRIVTQDNADAFEGGGATGFAAENDMQAIDCTADQTKTFGFCGCLPMRKLRALEHRAKGTIDGEGIHGFARGHKVSVKFDGRRYCVIPEGSGKNTFRKKTALDRHYRSGKPIGAAGVHGNDHHVG